jgi:3-keto-disaccharide hydrolase
VGRVASVHPAKDVKTSGSRLSFTSSESFGKDISVTWELNAANGKLSGTQKREDGVTGRITGVRAPALHRAVPKNWGAPEALFNGKDLTGWQPDKPAENHWKAQNGELVNEAAGANIRTTRKFNDFKLHIEYNCPQNGNSGVYLRGRYEVQVEYEPPAENDEFHKMGSIYGFIAPAAEVPPRPGQWESYDITLVGRIVTVVRDGVTTINQQEIPGITGGALDSHEGEPGPLYIQGDHTGGMKYRNIKISLPQQ